jgi:hypothetical protein
MKAGDIKRTIFSGKRETCRLISKGEKPCWWNVIILKDGFSATISRHESQLWPVPKEHNPEPVAKDLKAENERLRKMLETLQNERARFQASAIEDLAPEQRLELEVLAMKAFIKKALGE